MTDQALIDSLLAVLSQRGIELAILFGSRATERARWDSDVDIAVDSGNALTAEAKLSLVSEIGERIGLPIDLVDLRTVGEPLLGEILRDGKRLLGTDEQFADLVCRHLHDAADFLPYVDRILAERRAAWLVK